MPTAILVGANQLGIFKLTTSTAPKNSSKPQPLLLRDEYGALTLSAHLTPAQAQDVKNILAKASSLKDGIPKEYVAGDRKEFECLNHDVYDVQLIRGKVRGVVVQARYFWKHVRKARTRMTKTYYLVTANRSLVTVKTLDSATCLKRAKNTTKLGQLVGHYQGAVIVKCARPTVDTHMAYKVLAKADDGRLVSAFDGSIYELGTWRIQAAIENHKGGYYCYFDKTLAINATKQGTTFNRNVTEGKNLVLCEVEVSGRHIAYKSGKVAFTGLRVVRELEAVCLD